jgi:hypothetical protein
MPAGTRRKCGGPGGLRPLSGSADRRKSLGGGSGRSPRLNIRTPVDLYERALAKATKEGKTVSQLAREALEKYVT